MVSQDVGRQLEGENVNDAPSSAEEQQRSMSIPGEASVPVTGGGGGGAEQVCVRARFLRSFLVAFLRRVFFWEGSGGGTNTSSSIGRMLRDSGHELRVLHHSLRDFLGEHTRIRYIPLGV
jgi:hypothetical protein